MEIRTATPADATAIQSVARRSYEEDGADDAHLTDRLFERRYALNRLDDRLAQTDTVCLIAERGDEVVAFAEGTIGGGGGRVERLHVDPAHRAQGIGVALYERLGEDL